MKYTVSIVGMMLIFTHTASAKKKFVPIISDDLLTMVSYYSNDLKIPSLSQDNEYRALVVQCEDDRAYFIMAHRYYDYSLVTASRGEVVIDENVTNDEENLAYLKGHVDGNETVTLTGKVYYDNKVYGEIEKTCNRSNFSVENKLQVPTFNGNTQGKLVVQCESDVVYFIMAYDCLRSWTNPTAYSDNGTAVIDEKKHVGEVFYVKGHVKRENTDPVTITGKLLNEFDKRIWQKTCP